MFALVAVGSAIFILASGQVQAPLIAGAVLVVATGQALALIVQWMRNGGFDEELSEQGRKIRSMSEEIASAADHMEWMKKQIAQPIGRPLEELTKEVRTLRDKVQALTQDIANNRPASAELLHGASSEALKPATAKQNAATDERLDFLLEPVVELSTGMTVHYRARVNMVNQAGGEIAYEEMIRKADDGGVRAALDVHLARLAVPVLRRLRTKHPAMCLLLPLGAATLKTQEDVARLIQVMDADSETSRGIVLEIAHGNLAGLEAAGIEGLAKLARLGVKMALSQVSIAGLDLASLRQLGVRFLDIAAAGLNTKPEPAPAWVEFAQFARAMQFQMIVGGVESASQAEKASHIARFGYGSYFAPPRRVRAEAGLAAGANRTQAA